MDRSKAGTVTLTQAGLIDRILTVMDMEEYNPKFTPADKVPLVKYEDGKPCKKA